MLHIRHWYVWTDRAMFAVLCDVIEAQVEVVESGQ